MADTPSVVQCLSTAMELIRSVGKDGRNDQQNYNFRGIDAVVNAAGPAFRQVGIVVMPRCTYVDRTTVEVGRNRTQMALVSVRVTYRFYGPAGDYVEAEEVPGEAMDSGDKAVSKAMSVAYRIALLQALCIPTNDPDPDEHSYERSPKAEPEPERPGKSVADAKTELVKMVAGKVPGSTEKDHAKAIWAQAELDGDWVTPDDWQVVKAVADAYLADLEEMQGAPA